MGTVVVDYHGYNDYRLFSRRNKTGVSFVTRRKDNALFELAEERMPPQHRNVLNDQIIRLTREGTQKKCPYRLRRIVAVREDTGGALVFVSN